MTISYLPMTRDFTVFVGATFSQSFHWTSGGLDVDLSGWDAWMPYGSDLNTSLGELSLVAGSIILTAQGGIKLYLTDEETEAMFGDATAFPTIRGVTTLVYQLSLENELGEIMRFMRGNLYLQYDVGRPKPPLPHSLIQMDETLDLADQADPPNAEYVDVADSFDFVDEETLPDDGTGTPSGTYIDMDDSLDVVDDESAPEDVSGPHPDQTLPGDLPHDGPL